MNILCTVTKLCASPRRKCKTGRVWSEHDFWNIIRTVQGGPENGYPVLFWDNFGNSAPILTILSPSQAEIYWA